jgi:hypothetical protein
MNAERIFVGKPLGKYSLGMLKGDRRLALIWILSFHVRMVDGWNCLEDCVWWCVLILAFRFSHHIFVVDLV